MVIKSLSFSHSPNPLSLSVCLSFPSFYISIHCYVFTLFPLISVYLWFLLLPTTLSLYPFITSHASINWSAVCCIHIYQDWDSTGQPIQHRAVLLSKGLILGLSRLVLSVSVY